MSKQFYFEQFCSAQVQFKCQNSSISSNSVQHKYTVQFYLTHRYDPIRCYHSAPEWTWKWWEWMSTQHYWNLTIRLFSIISRTLVRLSYPSTEMQSAYSTTIADWARVKLIIYIYICVCVCIHVKQLEKKLDGNYTRMLRAILNKSWRQHPTRHQLYGHLPPITKTIQVRRTRHAGHCWRSRDELIRDVL